MLPPGEILLQYEGSEDLVWIIVEHPQDGAIFDGRVDETVDGEGFGDGIFLVDRDGPPSKKLNPRLDVTIWTDDPDPDPPEVPGELIDEFSIHTSCSVPLLINTVYGTTDPLIATLKLLGEPIELPPEL